MPYFVSFLVAGEESWLLCFCCILNVMLLLSFLPLPRVAVGWTLVCDIVAFPCHTHLHFELQSQNDVLTYAQTEDLGKNSMSSNPKRHTTPPLSSSSTTGTFNHNFCKTKHILCHYLNISVPVFKRLIILAHKTQYSKTFVKRPLSRRQKNKVSRPIIA